jgi:hypothetical protein
MPSIRTSGSLTAFLPLLDTGVDRARHRNSSQIPGQTANRAADVDLVCEEARTSSRARPGKVTGHAAALTDSPGCSTRPSGSGPGLRSDPSLLDVYSAATGTAIDTDALALYRMWYDLAEISLYIRWFRSSHDAADAAEGWQNLQHFLWPAQRWPHLLARPAQGT